MLLLERAVVLDCTVVAVETAVNGEVLDKDTL